MQQFWSAPQSLQSLQRDSVAPAYADHFMHLHLLAQVICYLETGSGKTLIACMLVKHFVHTHRIGTDDGPKAFFLVPTVLLVEQQAKVLDEHVPEHARSGDRVGMYSGRSGVDSWTDARWQAELACESAPQQCNALATMVHNVLQCTVECARKMLNPLLASLGGTNVVQASVQEACCDGYDASHTGGSAAKGVDHNGKHCSAHL